nr:hypothetical protein [Keratinibaculum paraultunense]
MKHFAKYKFFIIDEIGYLSIGKKETKMFFQLIINILGNSYKTAEVLSIY